MPLGISSTQFPRQFPKSMMCLSITCGPLAFILHSKQSNKLFNDRGLSRTLSSRLIPSRYSDVCDFKQHGRERVNGRIDSYRAHKQKI